MFVLYHKIHVSLYIPTNKHMSKISQLHVEVATTKHDDVKIIAVKSKRSQKDLIDEALDFLRQKYQDLLEK